MPRNLPPLDHLRAFEAAARRLSFKEAANEMNVTPAAVGQRIRALETILNCKLFVRSIRQVALTSEGQLLFEDMSVAISAIRNGISQHWARQNNRALRISTTNSFTELTLLPLLPGFTSRYPNENVRIISTDEKLDPSKQETDVCIRFGRGHIAGCETVSLGKEFYLPVCSPDLMGSHPEPVTPADVQGLPLVEEEWPIERAAAPTWRSWMNKRNIEFAPKCPMIKVSLEAHAVRAAVQGQGVAMVSFRAVAKLIENGTLVELFGPAGRDRAAFNYHLVWRKDEISPLVNKFVDWAKTALTHVA
ncbi:LysR substrate-binding domain-containing protein [Leisingera methylohalidivorans]|nr:LysR substrate-binding domain-containing protein [Leisingera methylohalidivorans]